MDKNEIIFFVIITIAYFILGFVLKIPQEINIIFGGILLVILIIMILAKLQEKYANEELVKIKRIIIAILIIIAVILLIYETWFGQIPSIHIIISLLFIVALISSWVLGKK